MCLSSGQIAEFWRVLLAHYADHGRHDLPWRQPEPDGSFDPYKIWLSEIMLQQTQVARVIPKYRAFLQRFPDVQTLAAAPLGDVLRAWQGLGYNRRAKYLWQTAGTVVKTRENFPATLDALVKLPGVGQNTAGAILAYAFDQPAVFIETNIRTVYFHHFFAGRTGVNDTELQKVLQQTLPTGEGKRVARAAEFISAPGAMSKSGVPKKSKTLWGDSNVVLSYREFYWALMDYGSWLKANGTRNSTLSRHYVRQSRFEGSRRQVRGRILRLLAEQPASEAALLGELADDRAPAVLVELAREGLIRRDRRRYSLA